MDLEMLKIIQMTKARIFWKCRVKAVEKENLWIDPNRYNESLWGKCKKGYKSNKTLSSNSYNCPNYPLLLCLVCSIEILNKWVNPLSFLSLFCIVALLETILHIFYFELFASYGNQWCKEQYFYNVDVPQNFITRPDFES